MYERHARRPAVPHDQEQCQRDLQSQRETWDDLKPHANHKIEVVGRYCQVEAAAGNPQRIHPYQPREGRFLMNTFTEQAGSPITLIVNWKPRS
jgi:hypothetical protein